MADDILKDVNGGVNDFSKENCKACLNSPIAGRLKKYPPEDWKNNIKCVPMYGIQHEIGKNVIVDELKKIKDD